MGKSKKKKNPSPLPLKETWSKGPQLQAREAWLRGPPQSTTAPSPRSQSAALSTPIHQTHPRCPSPLGQGVLIEDSVTVPRGQVKLDSVVTFGSIDSASAPISSSPAPIPAIESKGVKPCETVPATPTGHVNGKASKASRTRATLADAPSSPSALRPATSVPSSLLTPLISPTVVLSKHKKMFLNLPSAPSFNPASDSSSPSMRNTDLPSSSHPAHHGGPIGDPPRSPSYPRQMPNGTSTQPQMQPQMRPQKGMPWPGYYYPDQQPYVYAPWYPSMPTQHQPSPPHGCMSMSPRNPPPSIAHSTTSIGGLPSPPPISSSSSMPPDCPDGADVSPENLKKKTLAQSRPTPPSTYRQDSHGTPSMTHPTTSIAGLTSPPPTPPSSSIPPNRLNASSTFVPRTTKVILRKEDGTEVNLENLKHTTPAQSAAPPITPSTYRQDNPGTPNRRPASIRIESEDQRRQRLAEEMAREKEKARAKAVIEEKNKKEKEETECMVKEKRRQEEETEKERIRREERKEKKRIRREEERKEKGRMKEQERLTKEAGEREVQRIKDEEERQRREEEETEARHITKGRDKKDAEEWLQKEQERNIAALPLGALTTARVISHINTAAYPEGVSKLKSEDRFAASVREASVSWAAWAAGLQFRHTIGMTQMASRGDPVVDPKLTRTERNKAQNPNDASPGPSIMQHCSSPEFVQHFPPPASPVAAPAPPQTPLANPGPLALVPSLMVVNPEQIPLIPADRLPGADMNLDEFCAAYGLTDRVRNKLDDNGYCGTHTFQYVEWKDLREAGLKTGEIAQLKHAISKWSVPPGDGRG